MGRVLPETVACIRFPEQFCCPTHAMICKILTMEPFEPDRTMSPRQFSWSIAFCAIFPMESRVWLSMRLILCSASAPCLLRRSSAFASISAHSWRTLLAVSVVTRMSPMPIENPWPENQRWLTRCSSFMNWQVRSGP